MSTLHTPLSSFIPLQNLLSSHGPYHIYCPQICRCGSHITHTCTTAYVCTEVSGRVMLFLSLFDLLHCQKITGFFRSWALLSSPFSFSLPPSLRALSAVCVTWLVSNCMENRVVHMYVCNNIVDAQTGLDHFRVPFAVCVPRLGASDFSWSSASYS